MSCGNCYKGMMNLRIWAGLLWYGRPWPLRWRVQWGWPPIYINPEEGCGCLVLLKDAWAYAIPVVRHIWRSHKYKRALGRKIQAAMRFRRQHTHRHLTAPPPTPKM
jgi:hypothetical protein